MATPAALAAWDFRDLWSRTQLVFLPVGTALALLAAWQVGVARFRLPAAILPPPTAVAAQIAAHYSLLARHLIPTASEVLAAFAISVPVGILLAMVVTSSQLVSRALYPNVIAFQIIPKIALAPLFIIWLGIGSSSRISYAVMISFFPVLISTAAGLRSVNRDLLRLCRSVHAPASQVLWRVRLPTAVPYIFSGMKIAVTLSVIGIVVGEFIAAQAGLGYLILFASSHLQTDLCLAAIATLCGLGVVLYGTVALGERIARQIFGDG
jgi:NitT/TauT family transport system permease protein